jgi:polar amino acid transport system substrate-binding protein
MRWIVWIVLLAMAPLAGLRAQDLTIYCEEDAPNQMIGPDGQLTGMTVEIAREIQKRTGNRDPIQLVPWARGYEAIQKNPGVVLFSMSRTAERNPLFHWIGPVLETRYCFVAKANSRVLIKTFEDAKELQRIGVYNNDVRDAFLTEAGFRNLDRANNNVQNVKKLMAGRIDAYASSSIAIESEAQAAGYKASDVKDVFTFMRVQLYIAMSMGTSEGVVSAWSDAFAGMQKDGSFVNIFRKYYPAVPLPGKAITKFP